jgi:hypothetical protein
MRLFQSNFLERAIKFRRVVVSFDLARYVDEALRLGWIVGLGGALAWHARDYNTSIIGALGLAAIGAHPR